MVRASANELGGMMHTSALMSTNAFGEVLLIDYGL